MGHYSELLSRPQTDRVVLRAGRPIGTATPDYHELDGAFKGGPMGDISGQVAGLISSVLLALVGYLWTFYSTRITKRREAQLKRLDEQLRILYGPLYALSGASEAAWNSFMAKFAPEAGVFIKPDRPPTEEELSIWRSWITTVILPMNEEMEKLVRSHWDLVENEEIQPSLIQLVAHTTGYRWVTERWKQSDFRECHSVVGFPKEFNALIRKQHDDLRQRQMALLGMRR
jgi:hypothetical protein